MTSLIGVALMAAAAIIGAITLRNPKSRAASRGE